MKQLDERVQVSFDRGTVWVHDYDGSTVGRFSKAFGMDVHTTVTQQLGGASQCLACTHEPPDDAQWQEFCRLMWHHYQIEVPVDLLQLEDDERAGRPRFGGAA